jgi:hypothetical protein
MGRDHGSAVERLGIEVGLGLQETGRHRTQFKVEKYDLDQVTWTRARDYDGPRLIRPGVEPIGPDFVRVRCAPFETHVEEDCNLITDAGWTYIMNGFAGSVITKFVNAASGRIGLGITATAVTYGDVALSGIGALTTANWKPINAVPTVGNHTTGLILATTFGLTEANGVPILEFATDLGTTSTLSAASVAPMLTHGLSSPGTKTGAQVWNATVTITWT